jgi:hypothetical protein
VNGGWGATTTGLDRVQAMLNAQRSEVTANVQSQTAAAASRAASVLQQAAAARTGTVRTSVATTSTGSVVTAVANVPISRARVRAALAAGAEVMGVSP